MSQPLHTLVTHAGTFHSDELMALVLLERHYLQRPVVGVDLSNSELLELLCEGVYPPLRVRKTADGLEDARTPHLLVRTRSPEALAAARLNPTTFVIDVGGELDPAALNFDHHQASMKDTWDDGTPYSSTGLVWKWLRAQGHLNELSDGVLDELENALIRPLDAHDNGQAQFHLSMVCEGYNRHTEQGPGQMDQFLKALAFMHEAFDNHLHQAQMKVQSRQVLERAWEVAQNRNERHVVLKEPLAYPDGTGLLVEVSQGQAELLAIPGRGSRYSIISLPIEDRFSIKCPVPEPWRGLMDQTLEIEGKTIQLAFAHKTGFMCVIQGAPEDAHLVAKHIVDHNAMALERPADNSLRP